MAFTGKATYSAGVSLPELAEDVSDLIGIVSPHEVALLDHLGDPKVEARSTVHEWIEDTLLPNMDAVDDTSISGPTTVTSFDVANASRFRVGDLVRPGDTAEVMLVTGVSSPTITVTRSYGGTSAASIANGLALTILGNAALEGDTAPAARFTDRVRKQNYTQIFTSTVDVSGSMQSARAHGISDEVEYQKLERMRELLRDLENCVINGVAPSSNGQGSSTVRRSMTGILHQVSTNSFIPGQGGIPAGSGTFSTDLTEEVLNAVLREIWEQSSGVVDTIVVSGTQKRKINSFLSGSRSFDASSTKYTDLLSVYESDFGVCRVVMSRWVPTDALLLLDSSRISVMPLTGRSFHYKSLAASGDSISGQVIGEYTLEMKNENAHGVIRGLGLSSG
ncbi:MAG: DUF5309 family protein [Phycisphaeraceae bacterium]|nr:DUF5309 family protein [Phycisphaeraceae bacterium]